VGGENVNSKEVGAVIGFNRRGEEITRYKNKEANK